MNLQESLHLNDVPPERVFALMINEGFQRQKADRVGAIEFSMGKLESDGKLTVTTHRKMPTGGLPEFVKSMVSPTMTVHETERWDGPEADGSYHGTFDIEVSGAPVELRGSVSIVPVDGGSTVNFAGVVRAKVPLFKDRVAEASSGSIRETIAAEFGLLKEETGQVGHTVR